MYKKLYTALMIQFFMNSVTYGMFVQRYAVCNTIKVNKRVVNKRVFCVKRLASAAQQRPCCDISKTEKLITTMAAENSICCPAFLGELIKRCSNCRESEIDRSRVMKLLLLSAHSHQNADLSVINTLFVELLLHYYPESTTDQMTRLLLLTLRRHPDLYKDATGELMIRSLVAGATGFDSADVLRDMSIMIQQKIRDYPLFLPVMILSTSENQRKSGCIEKYLKEAYVSHDIQSLINISLLTSYNENHELSDFLATITTPSAKHIQKYVYQMIIDKGSFFKKILMNTELVAMINNALRDEEEAERNGFTSFYHGRRNAYALPGKWFTLLYGLKYKTMTDIFLFPHVKKPALHEYELHNEEERRLRLLREGNTRCSRNDYVGRENRQSILFTTLPLLGNCIENIGSSPIHYLLDNENAGYVSNSLQDSFELLGYGHVYKKYEHEMHALEKEYEQMAHGYGQLLALRIPTRNLAKYVYLTASGGPKQSLHKNGRCVDNINHIIAILKKEPSEDREFACVQTWGKNGALNPHSGIKISTYQPIESNVLKRYEEKERELFEKIKYDIDQEKH